MPEVCVRVCAHLFTHVCVHMHRLGSWALPLLSPIGTEGGVMDGWGPPSGLGVLTMI